MTQTPETHSSSPEKYVHHIIDLAKQVRDSEAYVELKGRGTPHPAAFKSVSERMASDTKGELNDADRALLRVVGSLGEFTQAQHELSTIYETAKGRYLDEDEKWVARNLKKEFIIPFNHHLKEFINTHPNDEIRTVSSALTNAYGTIFSRYECIDKKDTMYRSSPSPQEAFSQIQATLDGMRHEVAAETIIEATDYSYDREVSADEDAHGNDLFIFLESGWEGLDVKASPMAVAKARSEHRFSRAVWSGLEWGDFTGIKGTGHGTLSIPYATAVEKSDMFIQNVYEMVGRIKTERQAVARKTGKQTLRR